MECQKCFYWNYLEGEDGICKRNPPVLDVVAVQESEYKDTMDAVYWVQAITMADDYCGEWKSK